MANSSESITATQAALELHQAYRTDTCFPEHLGGQLNLEAAYDAQFELLALRQNDGQQLAGWKVGLTSEAMQQQQGVHEPCLGHLLVSGRRESGSTFDFENMMSPGIENELCLRIGTRLGDANPAFESVVAAVEAIAPALEVIEKRSQFGADFPLAMAGNAQQLAYVTGSFVPFDGTIDLANVEVSVDINGVTQERANGTEVLGNPLNSVIWLTNQLVARGLALEPGMLVMSGSFTKQYPVNKGDYVQAIYSEFGKVNASF
jgi:2-keto-4-pentenoate hydratase